MTAKKNESLWCELTKWPKDNSVLEGIKCFESNAFNSNTTMRLYENSCYEKLCNFGLFLFRKFIRIDSCNWECLAASTFCSAFESHYFRALSFWHSSGWVKQIILIFIEESKSQARRVHRVKMVKKRIKTQRKKKWFIRSLVLWISWLPLILVSFCVCVLRNVRTKTHDDDDETQKKIPHVK